VSYDLGFWKQKPTCTTPPSHIYKELVGGRAVESLEAIPTAAFVARVHQKFPGITEDGGLVFWAQVWWVCLKIGHHSPGTTQPGC